MKYFMKTKLITPQKVESKEIEWSKPALYRGSDTGKIVLRTGVHREMDFYGTCLLGSNEVMFSLWRKDKFTLITEPITIKINCDEE